MVIPSVDRVSFMTVFKCPLNVLVHSAVSVSQARKVASSMHDYSVSPSVERRRFMTEFKRPMNVLENSATSMSQTPNTY